MNKRLSLTYRMKTILIRLKKVEWYINQTVYTVGGNWDMKKTGIILGALLLAAGLPGCGGEKKEEAAKAPSPVIRLRGDLLINMEMMTMMATHETTSRAGCRS